MQIIKNYKIINLLVWHFFAIDSFFDPIQITVDQSIGLQEKGC